MGDEIDFELDRLEKHLEPFFKLDLQQLLPSLSLEDAAQFKITLAFALNALFYVFLKLNGLPPSDYEVRSELERIKSYMKKMKEITEEERQRISLNKEAAARFLDHALKNYRSRAKVEGKEEEEEEKKTKEEDGKEEEDTKMKEGDGKEDKETNQKEKTLKRKGASGEKQSPSKRTKKK